MIALWLVYTVLIGALAATVALGLERVAALWRLPRRGIWAAAIAVSLVTPLGVRLQPATTGVPAAAPVQEDVTAGAAIAIAAEPPIARRLVERVTGIAAVAARRLAPLDRPLLLLWGTASLLVLLALGRSALGLRARRRRWERRVVDGTEVLVAPDLGPAALAGAAPGIVLPPWALDMDAPLRRLVLRHELEHRAAGDPWLLLAGVAALALAPWNVALWWQVGRLRLAVEVDCDARVLRAHGSTPVEVERYGLLLLALGQRGGGLLRLAVPALSEPVSTLERRIAAMTDRTPRNRWLRALGLAGAVAAVTAVACVTPSPNRVLGPDGNLPEARVAPPAMMDANTTYFEFQVEEPVSPLNNARPVYPADLKARGVTGRVIVQFVVGVDGTPDVSTFKVLESDHEQFSEAVRAALPRMRFTTARIGGLEVKQLVQQPFVFDMMKPTPADPANPPADTATRMVTGAVTPLRASRPQVPGDTNRAFFEFRIEEPATPLNNAWPIYPAELRDAGTTGRVIVQFVVDTTGMADVSTFRVIESDHELFTAAVRAALPRMLFSPAKVDGHKVKQVLQQPFVFDVR